MLPDVPHFAGVFQEFLGVFVLVFVALFGQFADELLAAFLVTFLGSQTTEMFLHVVQDLQDAGPFVVDFWIFTIG